MTAFRGTGFREVLASENPYELLGDDEQETDLNMIQELCFVNVYLETGGTSPAYGARYLNELLNFVPRAIWPSKPLLGIDYAKWRGFESADSEDNELGVNTTIASGMIGGGVLNFGQIFGPDRSRDTDGPLDRSADPLVGTKKIAAAPGVVHAWRRSYLQPRPRHHSAGALACRICILFRSPY